MPPAPDRLPQAGAGPQASLGGASRPVWNFWREPTPRAFTGRSPSERVFRPGVQRRLCRTPARLASVRSSGASADPEPGTSLLRRAALRRAPPLQVSRTLGRAALPPGALPRAPAALRPVTALRPPPSVPGGPLQAAPPLHVCHGPAGPRVTVGQGCRPHPAYFRGPPVPPHRDPFPSIASLFPPRLSEKSPSRVTAGLTQLLVRVSARPRSEFSGGPAWEELTV